MLYRHNKKEQDQLPAHTYQRDTNVGKKKSSVHIQLSDWLRTLDMAVVTGLHLWKGNVLLSIGVGTAVYMVLVQAVFV